MFMIIFLYYSQVFCSELRIASLDPASSQLLIALNLNKIVVATDTLSHKIPNLTNTEISSNGLVVDYEKLVQQKISHVVAYDLGFTALTPKLKQLGIELVVLKNQKLADLIDNLKLLKTKFPEAKTTAIEQIEQQISALPQLKNLTYLLQIDFSPIYVAGKNTFIDDALAHCGLKNIVQTKGYPIWSKEQSTNTKANYIFVMSDVIKKQGQAKIESYWQSMNPTAKIKIIDADDFSRLTPKFVDSVEKLCFALNAT